MTATYLCKNCNKAFSLKVTGAPSFNADCPDCGTKSPRHYGKVAFTKEDENVSGALQLMLYSRKPSQE